MRVPASFLWAVAAILVLGCGGDEPTTPSGSSTPAKTHVFTVTPVRSPGGHSEVRVVFSLDESLAVDRTEMVIASTGDPLLPSPWASLYRINGRLVSEGRNSEHPELWEAVIEFDNQSQIVCTSCDDVTVEYRLWD